MSTDTKDTTGKKKFAFRDIRSVAALLASGRPPRSVQIKTASGTSKKLSKLKNKVAGATSKILKSKAVSMAASAALGPVAGAFAAKLLGKVKLPKFGFGKLGGGASKVTAIAGGVDLGAKIIEELDPDKIRRPLKEGLSASAAAMAEPLVKTVAASAATSLVSGFLGSGLPTFPRQFKTPASLVKSPRFFNPLNQTFQIDETHKKLAEKAIKHVQISTPIERLYPQRGLLEDEIMYRLVLLAENVYAPTNQYAIGRGWGSLTILEGFRAENSTTSPHETGEAMDITFGSGSLTEAGKCFALAQWMRDHILYDQLILCFDVSGGGQVWIHVSFRAEGRRRQVLTKAFNDTHVEGLHWYQWVPASAEGRELAASGEQFSTMLADRQQRLQPVGLDTATPQDMADNGFGGSSQAGECIPVIPPPGETRVRPDGTQYSWKVPDGVDISESYLRSVIVAYIRTVFNGRNPETETIIDGCGEPVDVSYWIQKAQNPDLFSDGYWRVGWNGYWESRIQRSNAGDCSGVGDVTQAGSAGIIIDTVTGALISGDDYFPCQDSDPSSGGCWGGSDRIPGGVDYLDNCECGTGTDGCGDYSSKSECEQAHQCY